MPKDAAAETTSEALLSRLSLSTNDVKKTEIPANAKDPPTTIITVLSEKKPPVNIRNPKIAQTKLARLPLQLTIPCPPRTNHRRPRINAFWRIFYITEKKID
ncbi:MAG: hypothetical protein QXE76_07775 [Candidatus Bathyarchaeia archaeon]